MIIDENYKRRVRITGDVGDVTPHTISVHDIDTGEEINNVYHAVITLHVERKLNTAELSYYESDERGILVGKDGWPITKTTTTPDPEVDVTAFEVECDGKAKQ